MYKALTLALFVYITPCLSQSGLKFNFVEFDTHQNFCPQEDWKLVFFDEFNDNAIDTNKWVTYYPHKDGSDQSPFSRMHSQKVSQQVFLDRNVVESNGTLKLIQNKEMVDWFGIPQPYSSAVIHSKQKFRTYSRYEIKCKMPKGAGLWSAFWLFGWSTEIDVFETNGARPNRLNSAVHYWNSGKSDFFSVKKRVDGFSKDFHVYSVDFEPYALIFKVDNIEIGRLPRFYAGRKAMNCSIPPGTYKTPAIYPEEPNAMRKNETCPVSIIAGVGIAKQGKAPFGLTAPNSNTVFPSQMEIDYIRVYQRHPQKWLHNLNANVKIEGSNIILEDSKNVVYKISNPSASDIAWEVSPNLEIVSYTNEEIVVNPKKKGQNWIKASRVGSRPILPSTGVKLIWTLDSQLLSLKSLF